MGKKEIFESVAIDKKKLEDEIDHMVYPFFCMHLQYC